MTLYNWRCPTCEEVVPGAYRPRDDNPCQICTTCSLRTGRVVQRYRDGRYGRAARSVPSSVYKGMDLQAELQRLVGLEIVPKLAGSVRLKVFRRRRVPQTAMGYACLERREIEIFVWPRLPATAALATLLHELAHLITGPKHDETWRSMLVELVREGYGVDPPFPSNPHTVEGLDDAVEAALETWSRQRA